MSARSSRSAARKRALRDLRRQRANRPRPAAPPPTTDRMAFALVAAGIRSPAILDRSYLFQKFQKHDTNNNEGDQS